MAALLHHLSRLTRSRGLAAAARALLTLMFWLSAIAKIADFRGAEAEMARYGLQPPALVALAVIAVQLAGAALVIVGGRRSWIGAGLLAGFTLLTIPVAHRFWAMTGDAAFLEMLIAIEHISIVGGLLTAALMTAGREPRGGLRLAH